MKYTLHHYRGRGLAKALHRSNNKTCTIQFPSRTVLSDFQRTCVCSWGWRDNGIRYTVCVCVCVCSRVHPLQRRCGFQGCLSAESFDDLIWVDQMNHTFYNATTHTSDRDLTTQTPSLPKQPLHLPSQHRDLAIVGQLWTNESIDLRHEHLTSQGEASVTLGGWGSSPHVTLCCMTVQYRPE